MDVTNRHKLRDLLGSLTFEDMLDFASAVKVRFDARNVVMPHGKALASFRASEIAEDLIQAARKICDVDADYPIEKTGDGE